MAIKNPGSEHLIYSRTKTEKKETQLKESDLGIEELLNIKKEKDDNNLEKNNDNSLEQSILKKIKTN